MSLYVSDKQFPHSTTEIFQHVRRAVLGYPSYALKHKIRTAGLWTSAVASWLVPPIGVPLLLAFGTYSALKPFYEDEWPVRDDRGCEGNTLPEALFCTIAFFGMAVSVNAYKDSINPPPPPSVIQDIRKAADEILHQCAVKGSCDSVVRRDWGTDGVSFQLGYTPEEVYRGCSIKVDRVNGKVEACAHLTISKPYKPLRGNVPSMGNWVSFDHIKDMGYICVIK